LTFWGAVLLFVRPQKYVRSDLMNSTALSSVKAVDRFIVRLGYTEKGVYLPTGSQDGAIAFIPAQPLRKGALPSVEEIESRPIGGANGVAVVPPGLGLASLIEQRLGRRFGEFTLERLRDRLPKVLTEDLEITDDFEMQVEKNTITMKLTASIYTDFCGKLKDCKRVCSALGCPMCSAMACVLAETTRKPVIFQEDREEPDTRIMYSTYKILDE